MKIDLHMHTKKVLDSESSSREINDAKKFKKIMYDASIQIAAITNHNVFDKNQYEKFMSDDESFLLLPGIEYDVNVSNESEIIKRRQINVIFDPNKIDLFASKVKENVSNLNNPIHINDIIDVFDSDNTIFYFDFKGGKTSWQDSEYEEYFFKAKKTIKGIPIFDTQKIATHFVLQANDYTSLIGSDNQNWDEYVEVDSKDLIQSRFHFKNYNTFIDVLRCKENLQIVKELRSEERIDISIENKTLEGIPIANGTNVIFGAKSTGKTKLLEEIYKNYDGSKVIYKSENYNDEYQKLINKDIDNSFKELIENLKNEVINISEYKHDNFSRFQDFYKSAQNPPKFKIQSTNLDTEIKIDENNYIDVSVEYTKLIRKLKLIFEVKNNLLYKEHLSIYQRTLIELKNQYLKDVSKYFSFHIIDNIKNAISEIIQKNKGQFSIPTTMGLIDLFKSRNKLWESIEKIKVMKKSWTISYRKFDIPDGNSWIHKQDLYLFDHNENNFIKDVKFNNHKFKNKKPYFESLSRLFYLKKYSDPGVGAIENIKNLITPDTQLYDLKNYLYNEQNPTSEPSNGEKAFISLFDILESNYNIFFLDEPETYLGNKMISISLIHKIKDLTIAGKKIIITTHVSSLGINTLPMNYIYRDLETYDDNIYKTYSGTFSGDDSLVCIRTGEKKDMIDHFIQYFEGDKKQFNFRRDIYESNKI